MTESIVIMRDEDARRSRRVVVRVLDTFVRAGAALARVCVDRREEPDASRCVRTFRDKSVAIFILDEGDE